MKIYNNSKNEYSSVLKSYPLHQNKHSSLSLFVALFLKFTDKTFHSEMSTASAGSQSQDKPECSAITTSKKKTCTVKIEIAEKLL